MLEIHEPLAGSRHLADERQTYFAVSANFLRLIQVGLFGKGQFNCISGREPHSCFRARRVRQGRLRRLTAAIPERGKNHESRKARRHAHRPFAMSWVTTR